jgi:hypothetical protein
MERFPWLTAEEAQAAVQNPATRVAVADELAAIVIYCLSLPVLRPARGGQAGEQRPRSRYQFPGLAPGQAAALGKRGPKRAVRQTSTATPRTNSRSHRRWAASTGRNGRRVARPGARWLLHRLTIPS